MYRKSLKSGLINKYTRLHALFNELGFMTHVKDENCPLCNFPETVTVRDIDGNFAAEYCSSAHCEWYRVIRRAKTFKIKN